MKLSVIMFWNWFSLLHRGNSPRFLWSKKESRRKWRWYTFYRELYPRRK